MPERRRPLTRKGRPTLTKELIAAAMLELAGRQGFRAVTMRVLAEHLGVTVRALYNYVEDRQEIVERAIGMFVAQLPVPEPDPEHWERCIADHCAALRTLYRRYPMALLVSLDEEIRDPGIDARRLTGPDAVLGLLRGIGLSVADALVVHRDLTLRVFGFVLLYDHRQDLGQPVMEQLPVPRAWLDAHLDLAVPHLREAAAAAPVMSVDQAFERSVADLLAGIRRLLG